MDVDIVKLNIHPLKAMMTSFDEMTRKRQAVDLKPRLDVDAVSYATCVKHPMVEAGVNICYYVQHI